METIDAYYTQGAKPQFFGEPDMACCKRLCDKNIIHGPSGVNWSCTTLKICYWIGVVAIINVPPSMQNGVTLKVSTICIFTSYIYFSSNIKQPGILYRYNHYENSTVVTLMAYIWCHTPVSGQKAVSESCMIWHDQFIWHEAYLNFPIYLQAVKFIIQMVISYNNDNNYMK